MTGKEQIEQILKVLDIKAPTFAKNIGLKYQRILDITIGKTKKISGDVANAIIAKYPDFNTAWLLTGDGEMLKGESSTIEASQSAPDVVIPAEVWQLIKAKDEQMADVISSLKARDRQVDEVIALLKEQIKKGQGVGDYGHVVPGAAQG